MVTYLATVPAVDAVHPSTRIGPLIRIGLSLGQTPDLMAASAVDRSRRPPRDLPVERSVAYGRSLTDIGNCRFCHRADLSGGFTHWHDRASRCPLARPEESVKDETPA